MAAKRFVARPWWITQERQTFWPLLQRSGIYHAYLQSHDNAAAASLTEALLKVSFVNDCDISL